MKKMMCVAIFMLLCSDSNAHLCNDVFVQARDNLAIKVEIRDGQLRVGKSASFKVYLLNTMDRNIAKIKMDVDTDAFISKVTPSSDWHTYPVLKTVKRGGKKQFFEISLQRKPGTPDGKYKIGLRLFYGRKEYKTIDLEKAADIRAVPFPSEDIKIDGNTSRSEWGKSLLASSFHERKKVGRYMENRVSEIQSRVRFSCDGKHLYCSYAFLDSTGSGIRNDRAFLFLAPNHETDPVRIEIDRTKGTLSCNLGNLNPDFKFGEKNDVVEARIPLAALNLNNKRNIFVNASRETSLDSGKKVVTYWRGNEMSVSNPIIFSNLLIPEPRKRKPLKKTTGSPNMSEADEKKANALLQTAIKMRDKGLGKWNVISLLKRIIENYPDTKAAVRAKKMLKEMQ